MNKQTKYLLFIAFIFISVFASIQCSRNNSPPLVLKLATTTSVENSGLLAALLPDFEDISGIDLEIIAVGTGQALALGENGDVDAVLVHAPALEEAFVENGFGTERISLMYNDFIIVGPQSDPARIASATLAKGALELIAMTDSPFVSRGDNSGTHFLEKTLWDSTSITPDPESDWYYSIGQGMGATLNFANETLAYTITDRGTYLAQSAQLPNLKILFGGSDTTENPDTSLYNYYSLIPINPNMHPHTQTDLVAQFAVWFTTLETQKMINEFGLETFNQSLFFPNSELWINANK